MLEQSSHPRHLQLLDVPPRPPLRKEEAEACKLKENNLLISFLTKLRPGRIPKLNKTGMVIYLEKVYGWIPTT